LARRAPENSSWGGKQGDGSVHSTLLTGRWGAPENSSWGGKQGDGSVHSTLLTGRWG
jgi:hypothetical protein